MHRLASRKPSCPFFVGHWKFLMWWNLLKMGFGEIKISILRRFHHFALISGYISLTPLLRVSFPIGKHFWKKPESIQMALCLVSSVEHLTAHRFQVHMFSGNHVPACLLVFPVEQSCTLASAPPVAQHTEPALLSTALLPVLRVSTARLTSTPESIVSFLLN